MHLWHGSISTEFKSIFCIKGHEDKLAAVSQLIHTRYKIDWSAILFIKKVQFSKHNRWNIYLGFAMHTFCKTIERINTQTR